MNKFLIFFIGLGVGLLLMFGVTQHFKSNEIVERKDTLIVYHDRLIIPKKSDISLHIDDIKVPHYKFHTDTIENNVYINIPITQSVYSEPNQYEAWVSGYEPKLDSIRIYNQTEYITTTVRVPEYKFHKNSVNISSDVIYMNSFYIPITLNYERMWKFGSLYAGAGYEVLHKTPTFKVGAKFKIDF